MATERDKYKTGRITAKTGKPTGTGEAPAGVQRLGLDTQKDGLLYVPRGYHPNRPAALTVMLHGAGGSAEQGLSLLRRYADEHNLILIAPASCSYSWDIIANDAFGPDVLFLEQALAQALATFAIDPAQVAIGGFSDGASYALCLGLTNGDLFTHILAFSPGFSFTRERHGQPAVFISHGVQDPVLPIDPCGRRVDRELRKQGLAVTYQEFAGKHEIPGEVADRAVEWFFGRSIQGAGLNQRQR
jgi:predicted esterase